MTGVIDKSPGLMHWAVNRATSYIRENLRPGVAVDELQINALLTQAESEHKILKQKAADAGTMVHQWIHDYISGRNPAMPVNKSLLNAINSFLKWEGEQKVKFHLTEQIVYSRLHNYAGTLDAEGEVDGRRAIIDFKTSNAVYDEMRFQVAAYQQARQEETGYEYHSRYIVRLGKGDKSDGTPDFEVVELDEFAADMKAFLGALEIKKRLMDLKSKRIQADR